MPTTPQERRIAQDCLEHLRSQGHEAELAWSTSSGGSGQLELRGPWGRRKFTIRVVAHLNRSRLALLLEQLQEAASRSAPLLLSDYVNPALADTLKTRGIAFVDALGNAFLDMRGLHVWVHGNRPAPRARRTGRLLRPAGLKLLFVILQRPEALQATYRELADQAGIALGTVADLMTELRSTGFAAPAADGALRPARFDDLLQRWESAYAESLRPKLAWKRLRWMRKRDVAQLADALASHPDIGVLVGGELGAALLTGRLRPITATLHVSTDDLRPIMKALELVPHPEGEIHALRTFGKNNAIPEGQGKSRPRAPLLADPLLIRAELLLSGDDRLMEIARALLRDHIAPRLP